MTGDKEMTVKHESLRTLVIGYEDDMLSFHPGSLNILRLGVTVINMLNHFSTERDLGKGRTE
jgi:hypothetical protein